MSLENQIVFLWKFVSPEKIFTMYTLSFIHIMIIYPSNKNIDHV